MCQNKMPHKFAPDCLLSRITLAAIPVLRQAAPKHNNPLDVIFFVTFSYIKGTTHTIMPGAEIF